MTLPNFEKDQEYVLQWGQELQKPVTVACTGHISISSPIHTQQSKSWAKISKGR